MACEHGMALAHVGPESFFSFFLFFLIAGVEKLSLLARTFVVARLPSSSSTPGHLASSPAPVAVQRAWLRHRAHGQVPSRCPVRTRTRTRDRGSLPANATSWQLKVTNYRHPLQGARRCNRQVSPRTLLGDDGELVISPFFPQPDKPCSTGA